MFRIIIISLGLLTACSARSSRTPTVSSAPSVASVPSALEQVPSQLSVTHFGSMRLEGKDLKLTQVEKNSVYTKYNATYLSNNLLITGVMLIPNAEGSYPLVLMNHGYIDPAVYTQGRGLKREEDYLARRGFAVFHSDYRGHAKSNKSPDTRKVYDAGLEYSMDVMNALHAIRSAKLPRVNADRPGIFGHSMGGGIALNILTAYPDVFQAAVLYAPVHADAWENFQRWRAERDEDDQTTTALGTRELNRKAWDALSSQSLLKNITAPVLLFHGTKDKDVPLDWSKDLTKRMTALKKDIAYVEYENEGHEFAQRWTNFMETTTAFLRHHLQSDRDPLLSKTRVTKKPFGIEVSPQKSPVSPERFKGFHTGTDFELLAGENAAAFEVTAICDGVIQSAVRVSGYGGAVTQRCSYEGGDVSVVYGHLAVSALRVKQNQMVITGQALGRLGKGNTNETDFERAHLHLGMHKGAKSELRGYVPSKTLLSEWWDTVRFAY